MDSRRDRTGHGAQLNGIPPFVRVVVPAFNKVELTVSCFQSLLLTEWPADRLDLVLVDNGSSDDTVTRIGGLSPRIRLVSSPENLGFAGGCNAGIMAREDAAGRSMGGYDYLALINNDAIVGPSWLKNLVDAAERNPDVGVVAAKILLSPKFSEVVVTPLQPDSTKDSYLEIRNVLVNGTIQDHRLKFDEVFVRDSEVNSIGRHSHWLGRHGALRVIENDEAEGEVVLGLELSATSALDVRVTGGSEERTVRVPGPGDSVRVQVPLSRQSFDVINSVGGELYRRGFGGDRGYLERDFGQFEEPAEVFSWCGAGAVLRKAFLDEVGAFDARLFLYYEDFDLSWRGRLAGWRYLYEPKAVIRHQHAQTSVEGSEMFRFFTARNRLLVLTKNAPMRMAAHAFLGESKRLAESAWRSVVSVSERVRIDQRRDLGFRLRVMASFFRHVPWMLIRRWTMVRRVGRHEPLIWMVDKFGDPGFVIDRGVIVSRSGRTPI